MIILGDVVIGNVVYYLGLQAGMQITRSRPGNILLFVRLFLPGRLRLTQRQSLDVFVVQFSCLISDSLCCAIFYDLQ